MKQTGQNSRLVLVLVISYAACLENNMTIDKSTTLPVETTAASDNFDDGHKNRIGRVVLQIFQCLFLKYLILQNSSRIFLYWNNYWSGMMHAFDHAVPFGIMLRFWVRKL
jgi:hypothetical protein